MTERKEYDDFDEWFKDCKIALDFAFPNDQFEMGRIGDEKYYIIYK